MLLSFRVVPCLQRLCLFGLCISLLLNLATARSLRVPRQAVSSGRERTSLNADWRFARFTSNPDGLNYTILRPWILPAANDFLSNTTYERPSGTAPGSNVSYVQSDFNDGEWEQLSVPHDWAISGTFDAPGVDGGLGFLPINGIGWYRRNLEIDANTISSGKSVFLDIDGAMAYAAVWLNGNLVGGWPFGYNSFRLDLTSYVQAGDNTLAIRLENALDSSRWYPGAGIYRNVWLVTVEPVHIGQFGTYITTPTISEEEALLRLVIEAENKGNASQEFTAETEVFELDKSTRKASGEAVAQFASVSGTVAGRSKTDLTSEATVQNPKLWGPPPTQTPNEYIAITTLSIDGNVVDSYDTVFGIRTIVYDPDVGIRCNGERIYVQGSCNHHDLGSLGAAFNTRAAERQLELLQEMGHNSLRTAHNPPAAEYLDLADAKGLMVMDEIFDTWTLPKTDNDFHIIFEEWSEPDLRTFLRRDRNHPSVISWSVGNELLEQSNSLGAVIGRRLQNIVREEDPTRQVTIGMNDASPSTELASIIDIVGLNYQGEGKGNSFVSTFPGFKEAFPEKMIWSTETASTLSSRGEYLFPVTPNVSAIVGGSPGDGADPVSKHLSSYDLYAPSWAGSPDKIFAAQDRHPYVAGEFVWTGFDYIGEPTPYANSSRSSYFGIIDLAGFKKDRFYLYQSRWRPDLPMAHILPHWNWPDRVGQVTPVHVYTSGDEAELFINDVSVGRKQKAEFEYRLRWDDVTYTPGSVRVVAYKDGAEWATAEHVTTGAPASLNVTADRTTFTGDGRDLSFVTVTVLDDQGRMVPTASNNITFSISSGPGVIVSTDNGDPTDKVPFPSLIRNAFNGLALAIVRTEPGSQGEIVIEATSGSLTAGQVVLTAT